jgi:hypothetical protein
MSAHELEEPTRDRSIPLLIAAAVVVVVSIALVVAFGIKRPPALESIAAASDAPTEGLVRFEYEREDTCLVVYSVAGGARELTCELDGGEILGWQDGRIGLRSWSNVGEEWVVVDASSGAVLSRQLLSAEDTKRFLNATTSVVRVAHKDGVMTVTLASTGATLWTVEAPTNYRAEVSALTADGRWVAMIDTARRLLLVPADGSSGPFVWLDDIEGYWEPIRWEGTGELPE